MDYRFPNGFDDWASTHHEIVKELTLKLEHGEALPKLEQMNSNGCGNMWEYSMRLAFKFEELHEGRPWEQGEFDNEMTKFLNIQLDQL
jgi:hypothetical protein